VEVSKCAPQEAFRDLERAVRNWREGRAGFPRFKRKKALADNKARLTGSIRVTPRHVQLPRIGKVRTKERTDKLLELLQSRKARILSATISREADRWFVSLTCEVERPDPEPREIRGPEDVAGIDVGLEAFAVLSDGTRMEAPKPLEKALRLLKRRSKQLSRKQKQTVVEQDPETGKERKRTVFSRNYEKDVLRLARLHRRVRNIRRDFLHKVATELAKAKPVLVVEDLNGRGTGVSRGPFWMWGGGPSGGCWSISAPGMAPISLWYRGTSRPRSGARAAAGLLLRCRCPSGCFAVGRAGWRWIGISTRPSTYETMGWPP
jgi:putative transposase